MPRRVDRFADELANGVKKDLAEASDNFVWDNRTYHMLGNGVLIVKSYEEDGTVKDARKIRIVVDNPPSAAEWNEMESQDKGL